MKQTRISIKWLSQEISDEVVNNFFVRKEKYKIANLAIKGLSLLIRFHNVNEYLYDMSSSANIKKHKVCHFGTVSPKFLLTFHFILNLIYEILYSINPIMSIFRVYSSDGITVNFRWQVTYSNRTLVLEIVFAERFFLLRILYIFRSCEYIFFMHN